MLVEAAINKSNNAKALWAGLIRNFMVDSPVTSRSTIRGMRMNVFQRRLPVNRLM
jgi:hypothetical protein